MRGMVLFEVEIGAAQSITEGVSSHVLLEHELEQPKKAIFLIGGKFGPNVLN